MTKHGNMHHDVLIKFSILFILSVLSGCGNFSSTAIRHTDNASPFISFHDIPGITDDEIQAVEDLIKQGISFVYGTIPSTESFVCHDGKINGFTPLLCEWLTELFGITFEPRLYNWNDILTGLESSKIDFTGELTATSERLDTYFITDAIALRLIKYFRIAGSAPLSFIAATRPVRIAFLSDTSTIDTVSQWIDDNYEIFYVSSYEEAYQMLTGGTIDAFIEEHTAEAAFDIYGDVITATFFPLTYTPVSLATQKNENAPIISIVQKALQNGGKRHLTELYNASESQYKKHKFNMSLTAGELEYKKSNPIVKFVSEHDNYPVSFYNARENEFQGIFFDVLKEIEMLTDLRFEQINCKNQDWAGLLDMLENGDAAMTSELLRTPGREGRFLWAENSMLTDRYALLSKSDFPNININEIANVRVGLVESTGQAEIFNQWFPNHSNKHNYFSFDQAFNALTRREIDVVMGGLNQLLVLTHFRECPGYKANIVFDFPFESTFGFNLTETVLCSVIDKSLLLIDTDRISGNWMRRTYDYRGKVAEARLPWFIGTIISLLIVIVLVAVLSYKKRMEERLVARQKVLATEKAALDKINRISNEMMENLTHEMRTPLAVMSAYAQYTIKEADINNIPEQTADDLRLIISEAKRLAEMSSGVLESFNDNKISVEMVPFSIADVVHHVKRLAVPLINKNNNTLAVNVDEGLPLVFGRAGECTQVILNLLSNAAAHTNNGTIIISAALETISEKPMLAVTVSDNGSGIPDELLPAVFMRHVTTGTEECKGLGLSICRKIIKEHGGTITVENGEKSGVVARFTLPLADREER